MGKGKMQYLLKKIQSDLGIPCYAPANGVSVNIDATHTIPVSVSRSLLKKRLSLYSLEDNSNSKKQKISVLDKLPIQGLLVTNTETRQLRLLEAKEAIDELGLVEHNLNFEYNQQLSFPNETLSNVKVFNEIFSSLNRWLSPIEVQKDEEKHNISVRTLLIGLSKENLLSFSWSYKDEDLASTAR